jgi:HPt (histidine-containing phosphotransfer) domain-containing protein
VINYPAALKRLGGDSDLFRKIIDLFDEDAPGLLQTIREAAAASDPARLQRAAHSLKGLAANFGAQDVIRSASHLENMSKSGQLANAGQAVSELEREIERLDKALAPHRASPTARSPAPQT